MSGGCWEDEGEGKEANQGDPREKVLLGAAAVHSAWDLREGVPMAPALPNPFLRLSLTPAAAGTPVSPQSGLFLT